MESHHDAYVRLSKQLDQIQREARAARAKCTQAFARCAAGNGTGPSEEEIAQADALEARADAIQAEMHQHVRAALGIG